MVYSGGKYWVPGHKYRSHQISFSKAAAVYELFIVTEQRKLSIKTSFAHIDEYMRYTGYNISGKTSLKVPDAVK